MNRNNALIGSLLALASLAGAQAQDIGQHPAVFSPRQLPAINPSTFIVAHPASLSWQRGHANHAHPAVSAHDARPGIDTGSYLVQPPASTRWTLGSSAVAPALAQGPTTTVR